MLDSAERAEETPVRRGDRVQSAEECAAELRELQRKAARIQHEINNPLAALLAEAQLLATAPLAADHSAAVERIIELTRRLTGRVRAMDALRGDESPP
ncbi:MAG: hypothetical protein M3373_12055 [Gemmatimonadota bacterium]|nr:hypothetical protein [Gemmatimonadota bacterium]